MGKKKIQGYLGKRDPLISIIVSGIRANPKNRKKPIKDIVAVERFQQDDKSFRYIETPIKPEIAKDLDKAKAYLEENRRVLGKYLSDDFKWDQGIKHTKSKGKNPGARSSATPEFTSEISGNLDHKTTHKIKRIIRMGDKANAEFMSDIFF